MIVWQIIGTIALSALVSIIVRPSYLGLSNDVFDRSDYTPEECQDAADSLERVGGVYNYIAAGVRAQNPVRKTMYYQVREGSNIIAIRETIEEADKLVENLSFTGKTYVVLQVNGELKYRNANKGL